MNALLKKLNFKNQQSLTVLNAPEEFATQMEDFAQYLKIVTEIEKSDVPFFLIFCQKLAEVEHWAPLAHAKLEEDGLFWFAYPKKSSKKYACDFNRDNGWQALGKLGFEPVRMVAIDEDWSALRFRKAEQIKEMKRNPKMMLSEEGKKRTKK
ncbi:hypothetical protein LAG90_11110 [Marinilongibacter aquaticus]|uniref:hypothetical protein n=1 Tax=Marinilongibacter aquaticus TaxID=2975157 RepID=UPI0021BDB04A|nr:hypothetical protein [Marinilongibacter aquaticus]UBM57367.1 hypothetical protein LAG90_11110 [Marinilongibacter aquaticus]